MIRFGAEFEDIQYEGQPSSVYFGLPMYEKVDIQAMIDDAVARGEHELTIPRGAYRIQAREGASAHISMQNMENFVLHAQDVVFLFQDFRVTGLLVAHCHNVAVEGLSIDFEPNPHTQMKITHIDPDSQFVEGHIDEGFMTEWNDMYAYKSVYPNYFYDGTTYREIKKSRPFSVNPQNIEMLGDRNVRIHHFLAADLKKRLRPGDYLTWCPRYIMRPAISMVGNRRVLVKDVTAWSGGFGVVESGSHEKKYYNRFCVVPGPRLYKSSEDRICSTSADAAHMPDNYAGATIENGIFHSMGDDGVNFYGYYTRVAEVISEKEFIIAERSNYGTNARENLRFYDGEKRSCIGERSVEKAERITGEYKPVIDLTKALGASTFRASSYYRVTLKKPIAIKPGDFIYNTARSNNGFVLRNNKYINLKSRGVLIKGSYGVIENCLFEDCKAAIQIRPELNWGESGYSQNVSVINNTVIRCGEGVPALSVEGCGALDQRNILIEGNDFIDIPCTEMLLESCRDVTVRNNRFTQGNVLASKSMPAVAIGVADGVSFEGNIFDRGRTRVGVTSLSKNIMGEETNLYAVASNAVPKGEQGYDGWYYEYAPIGTHEYIPYPVYRYETKGPDGWHVEDGNDDDYGKILAWWVDTYMRAGELADVVKTYVCPRDGEIHISAYHDCMTGEATKDGVRVMTLHNEELLWETTLGYMEFITPPAIRRTVKAGDKIHFRVSKINTAENSGVDWDPMIVYVK